MPKTMMDQKFQAEERATAQKLETTERILGDTNALAQLEHKV